MPNILEVLADYTLATESRLAGRCMLLGVGKFPIWQPLPDGKEKSTQTMKEHVSSGSLSLLLVLCLCCQGWPWARPSSYRSLRREPFGGRRCKLGKGGGLAWSAINTLLCLNSCIFLLANHGSLKFRFAVSWFR